MAFCPHSGRTVDDDDEFCANCARKLFLKINNRTTPSAIIGHWVICPKCRGSSLIDNTDDNGNNSQTKCDHPGCKNGWVWVEG